MLDAVEWLAEHEGAEVSWLEVDRHGRVHPDVLRAALERRPGRRRAGHRSCGPTTRSAPCSRCAALADVAAEHGVPFHTDAVQAVGQLPVDVAASGVDALTLTGHKFGGPLGVGALVLGRDVACTPLLHGGGQERDVRSGTLDTAGDRRARGGAETAVAAPARSHRPAVGAARRPGAPGAGRGARTRCSSGDPVDRLPGNAHFSFPGCEGDSLLLLLDARGVECSTGSACSAGVARP